MDERGKSAHQCRGQENLQCSHDWLLHDATINDLERDQGVPGPGRARSDPTGLSLQWTWGSLERG